MHPFAPIEPSLHSSGGLAPRWRNDDEDDDDDEMSLPATAVTDADESKDIVEWCVVALAVNAEVLESVGDEISIEEDMLMVGETFMRS